MVPWGCVYCLQDGPGRVLACGGGGACPPWPLEGSAWVSLSKGTAEGFLDAHSPRADPLG